MKFLLRKLLEVGVEFKLKFLFLIETECDGVVVRIHYCDVRGCGFKPG